LNEELNLPGCLASLRGVSRAPMVVDSGSTDCTSQIAKTYGARFVTHPFESHARQWAWALQQLEPDVDWVLGLDADQRLSDELRHEIVRLFAEEGDGILSSHDGFYLNRRQIFRGQWIRHGGYYPKYLLKLFRVGQVQLDERDLMDHHFYVSGRVARLRGDLIEDNLREADIGFWIVKHVHYAELHAREEIARRGERAAWLIQPALFGTPDQRVVWLKRLWFRMPLYVRPFGYFAYRYIVRRGFLDGKQGFIFHVLQGFWYRLLVDVRIDDLKRHTQPGPT
jgi:glycosyltransferase involved in cell wall biosynthesis